MTMTKRPSKLTRACAAKHLAILAETLGTKMDSVRLEGYWLALSAPKHGITDESLAKATEELISTCDRMPPPVEIIKLARRTCSAGVDGMYLPAAEILEKKATCLFHRQPGNQFRRSSEQVWFCPACVATGCKQIRSKGDDSPKQLSAILDDSRALAERVKKEG